MSKHSTGQQSRQFIARPIVAVALTVILIAGVVTAWSQLGEEIDKSATTDAATCVEGDSIVPLIADPAIAPGLQRIAQEYNKTKPVVRDHCVSLQVRPGDARATLEGLTAAKWDGEAFGAMPGAWIPESSVWAAALEVKKPARLQGKPESLVTTPVRLAVESELAKAADGRISWSDLPNLTLANSLDAFSRSSWGSLRMAMPNGPQSDATALIGQAVAAATAKQTARPLTQQEFASPAVTNSVRQLVSAPPTIGDGSIEDAIAAISSVTNPATAQVRAVPVTEQRLFVLTKDDKQPKLAAVAPTGITPVADYPVVKLAGDLVPSFMSDTVTEFLTFARKPPQMAVLTRMGFRGSGPLPAPTATVAFGPIANVLLTPEPAATVAINRIVLPAAA